MARGTDLAADPAQQPYPKKWNRRKNRRAVNGRLCRLRNVSHFYAQTSMGTKPGRPPEHHHGGDRSGPGHLASFPATLNRSPYKWRAAAMRRPGRRIGQLSRGLGVWQNPSETHSSPKTASILKQHRGDQRDRQKGRIEDTPGVYFQLPGKQVWLLERGAH